MEFKIAFRKITVFSVFCFTLAGIALPAFAAAPISALIEGANGSKPLPKTIPTEPSFSLQTVKLCLNTQFSENDMKNFSAGLNPSENAKAIMSGCLSSLIKSLLALSGNFGKFSGVSQNQSAVEAKILKSKTISTPPPTSLISPLNLTASIMSQFLGLILKQN